ncbi:MAG: hypothetical protein O3B24_00455 [Verrucomicrobia bacterium]|nr:hypothetical protein [Verrucomicrobiota bacterium]
MNAPSDPINYSVADRDLKYYIFDWDDNILHMPTRIHIEKRTEDGSWAPHAVSTAAFSVIRSDTSNYRPPGGDWENAFVEFRDFDDDDQNVFLRDTRAAIDRVLRGESPVAPSLTRFKRALIEGRIFGIVTARGHNPHIIRAAVEYFIDTALTPDERAQMLRNLRGYMRTFAPQDHADSDAEVLSYYLDLNKYHGVMSSHFKDLMRGKRGTTMQKTEEGKQFAIHEFVEHVLRIARERGLTGPISVGFSDDDVSNARAVEDYIRQELARQFPAIKFVVYYTSDPETPSGRKVVVQGQLTLDLKDA